MIDEAINELKKYTLGKKNTEKVEISVLQVNRVIKALEQQPETWSLDDAREDFMSDVCNTLDFLPTNEEANSIIDSFDRVTSGIKKEPKWIPVTYRELDEENERQLYPDADYIYNCNLPDDGQEVLITTKYRQVVMTTFYNDGDDGCYFECYEDEDDVLAWMPLPEPYKAERED